MERANMAIHSRYMKITFFFSLFVKARKCTEAECQFAIRTTEDNSPKNNNHLYLFLLFLLLLHTMIQMTLSQWRYTTSTIQVKSI